MARVEDILTRARDVLADSAKTRWDDASLIRRLNEGQRKIAKKTEIFKKTVSIQLEAGKHLYTMPDDFIVLKSAMFSYEPLSIVSAQQMERLYGAAWRTDTTTDKITACVTDRQDARTIRVYPRPFMTDLYDTYTFDPDVYGLEDMISEYTFDTNVGIIGTILDTALFENTIEAFGIVASAIEGKYLSCEYVRDPVAVSTIYDDPELPPVFDTALVRYVAGMALRDDIDSQNRTMGNEELQLFQDELDDIEGVSKHSNTTNAANNRTEYRGMGE